MHSPAIVAARGGFVPWVAVTLWLELLGAAAFVLLVCAALAWWQNRRSAPGPSVWRRRARRLTRDDLARMLADVDSLNRHAATAAAAATEAGVAVARLRERCRDAQRAREQAWQEYDAAQSAYANAVRNPALEQDAWPPVSTSGAWPVLVAGGAETPLAIAAEAPLAIAGKPATAGRPSAALAVSHSDDEPAPLRDLSHAALAAYRRGDLSVEQLREVFRRFSGWDGRHERHEREVLRRRAAELEAHRRYDLAAAAERTAYHEVDVATVAARAWADEAAEAAEEARVARVFASECLRHAVIRRRLLAPR